MYTNKRELSAALKLAALAKNQAWPTFARFKRSRRGAQSAPAGESLEEFLDKFAGRLKDVDKYVGVGLMQTTCGLWESEFYFRGAWAEDEITVSLELLDQAVKTLGNGEVELVVRAAALHIFQGKEDITIPAMVFSEEMKKQIPSGTLRELNRGLERWLNIYEFSGVIKILKHVLPFAGKTDTPYGWDSVYVENRARSGTEHEDLILAAQGGPMVAAGRQLVDRLGGFGFFLMPANAARKLCAAAKLFTPEGALLRLDSGVVSFEVGRAIISAKLNEDSFINPDIARPQNAVASFNLDRAQLTRFSKKTKIITGGEIIFRHQNNVLAAAAGSAAYSAAALIPNGQDRRPDDNDFSFKISSSALCDILSTITADTVNLYYSGETMPLYISADGVNYAVLPIKEEKII